MAKFSIGEEVRFEGDRFTISSILEDRAYGVRLLRTTPQGMQFVWARMEDLVKMESYTTARDDTARA